MSIAIFPSFIWHRRGGPDSSTMSTVDSASQPGLPVAIAAKVLQHDIAFTPLLSRTCRSVFPPECFPASGAAGPPATSSRPCADRVWRWLARFERAVSCPRHALHERRRLRVADVDRRAALRASRVRTRQESADKAGTDWRHRRTSDAQRDAGAEFSRGIQHHDFARWGFDWRTLVRSRLLRRANSSPDG